MVLRQGLAAYPDDAYYDPGRPSWLPYWLDSPTESALKFGLYPGVTTVKPLPVPVTPPGPGPYVTPAPGETQEQAQSRSDAAAYAAWRVAYEAQAAQTADEEAAWQAARDASLNPYQYLVYGALGIGALVLFVSLRR